MSDNQVQYLALIDKNRERIFRIASFYGGTEEDRQDLMQEIAYQVWRSFLSFRHDSSRDTWLYSIAINTAMQFLKRHKRKKSSIVSVPIIFDIPQVESSAVADEGIGALMAAIQKLGAMDRAIILLYLEENSHEEIAEIVNLSKTNVGTRIQRIKQKLRKRLNANSHGH